MPVQADFTFSRMVDGVLTVQLKPATSVGGWNMDFRLQKRFGPDGSGLMAKSMASGIASGASGMAVLDSGQGIFSVIVNSLDTSGLEYGAYAGQIRRLDSGSVSILSEGYLSVT